MATEVVLQPAAAAAQDTYLNYAAPNDQHGVDYYANVLWIGVHQAGAQYIRRTVVKFNFTGITPGFTSAVLSLYCEEDQASNASDVDVFRMLRAWVHAEATWNSYSTGNAWGTAGASNTTTDREAAYIATKALANGESTGQFKAWTLDNTAVAAMCGATPAFTNNGFLLKSRAESADGYCYSGSAATTAANRPKIVFTYPDPGNPHYYYAQQ